MKQAIDPRAVSDFLLEIYTATGSVSPVRFAEFVIDRLKHLVDFDMSLFGLVRPVEGVHVAFGGLSSLGLNPLWIHMHREPRGMLDEWLSFCGKDQVLQEMLRTHQQVHSFHAPSSFRSKEQAFLLDFAVRKRHLNILGMASTYGDAGLTGAISLRRADASWRFTAHEEALAQMLLPHVWEAIRINRALTTSHVQRVAGEPLQGLCVCDDAGIVLFQDAAFERLRTSMFGDPHHFRLPAPLTTAFIVEERPNWEQDRLAFSCRRVAHLRFVTVVPRTGLNVLSKRERQIAHFFGTGLTHAEIAEELTIAGSTVRRHIESIYRKLNIRNKADLAFLVHSRPQTEVDSALAALEAMLAPP